MQLKISNLDAEKASPDTPDFFSLQEVEDTSPPGESESASAEPAKAKRKYKPRAPRMVSGSAKVAPKDEPPVDDKPELREKIKVLFISLAQKLFAFLERMGADALSPDETIIVNELIEIQIGLVETDKLESVRRGAKWALMLVVVVLLVAKIMQIIKRRKTNVQANIAPNQ